MTVLILLAKMRGNVSMDSITIAVFVILVSLDNIVLRTSMNASLVLARMEELVWMVLLVIHACVLRAELVSMHFILFF